VLPWAWRCLWPVQVTGVCCRSGEVVSGGLYCHTLWGQVVELGVFLMVGRGLIPLLGVLYHPDTLAGSTRWGSKPNGVI